MKYMLKFIWLLVGLFSVNSFIFAEDAETIHIYASNNTKEILPQEAYSRLTHYPQSQLINEMTTIFQRAHLEQGRFTNVLGLYKMSTTGNETSDNTAVFSVSPYQVISDNDVFQYAQSLSKKLNQDSVAVFIPKSDKPVGDVTVKFVGEKFLISELIKKIDENLPLAYSQAYSMTLNQACAGFNETTVSSVEWLGSHINPDDLKTVFLKADVIAKKGSAYLVYQSGEVEPL